MKRRKNFTFSVRQVGKWLNPPIGEKKLFELLRLQGFLLANNEPAQKYIDNGAFSVIMKKINITQPPKYVLVPRVNFKGLSHIQRAANKYYKNQLKSSNGNNQA